MRSTPWPRSVLKVGVLLTYDPPRSALDLYSLSRGVFSREDMTMFSQHAFSVKGSQEEELETKANAAFRACAAHLVSRLTALCAVTTSCL